MRKVLPLIACFLLALTALPMSTAHAEKPFGFSAFHPAQYPRADQSIRGVRFNLIYGVNRNVTGLDIGLLFPVNVVTNDFNGIQLGLYNRIGNQGQGIQWGAVNITDGKFKGLQAGFYNQANFTDGVQFGLVNITERLSGLQIGLANIKGEPGSGWPREVPHEFFPMVNWTF